MKIRRSTMQPAGAGFPLGVVTREADGARAVMVGEGEGHRLILGPIGSGKFWAAIAPLLLTADTASAVVFDVATGEAFNTTAKHRGDLGPVLKLDPYGETAGEAGGLNPLDALTDCGDPDALVGIARDLAEAVVMTARTGGDADFWNDSAKDYCAALLIHVATSPHETERTLGRVRDLIVRDPLMRLATPEEKAEDGNNYRPTRLLDDMMCNEAAHGYVADHAYSVAADFASGLEKQVGSARRTLQTQTSFLDDRRVRRSMDRSTLDLRDLREKVATLYVVAPTKHIRTLGRWLRLVYTTVLGKMLETKDARAFSAGTHVPLHVILDEFPQFGTFERVASDMATVRKYGLHYHIAAQKISQLSKLYTNDGWEAFLPDCFHVLGCDEHSGAKYISEMLGTAPRMRPGNSKTRSANAPSATESETEVREPIMFPHQILEMSEGDCLVIGRGENGRLKLAKWYAYADAYLLSRADNVVRRGPPP